ncbi:hypothetical protein RhiirC2_784058 [Rhizophagus irregularis]|uniref:Uncharacterized protein n=1 Tax=Rhizophagus irregularis TaxID=588596 RepID=A0A2N1MZD5_9GLOM|nr:hypothetical protein RhiirC2_784058 [Rhizophagus irregularis]
MRGVLENNNDHINRQNENQNRDAVNQQPSETDRELLRRFHSDNRKVNNTGNNTLKKVSADNNMDLGEVPEELKGLTETEEIWSCEEYNALDTPTVPVT